MNPPVPAETATFAGGCFWCIEEIFRQQPGVARVESGYTGGTVPHPTYAQVCQGDTGHAEAIRIVFDPQKITYEKLLDVFWTAHDPTQLNRQGPDTGPQYRNALVPLSAEQAAVARAYLAQLKRAKLWDKPIVTRIETARTFYPAEAYHQDFAARNPRHGYIVRWDAPKVAALKRLYPASYRPEFKRN